MNCAEFHEALAAHLAGEHELPADAQTHSAGCTACARERDALESALGQLSRGPVAPAPPGFAAAAWARLDTQRAAWERDTSPAPAREAGREDRPAAGRTGPAPSAPASGAAEGWLAHLADWLPLLAPMLAGAAVALAVAIVAVLPGRGPVTPRGPGHPAPGGPIELAQLVTVHAGHPSVTLAASGASARVTLGAGEHAALSHEDAASVILTGPAHLELERGGRVRLDEGMAAFDVQARADRGAPYEVSTPDATVQVLGTAFSVTVDTGQGGGRGRTVVEVTRGRVKVAAGASERVLVAGGREVASGQSFVSPAVPSAAQQGAGTAGAASASGAQASPSRPPVTEPGPGASGRPAAASGGASAGSGASAPGVEGRPLPSGPEGASLTNPFGSEQTRPSGR